MIELFGLAIHEPDVALTDLALALETGVFAWLIRRRRPADAATAAPPLDPDSSGALLRALLVALFLAMAASSLSGALFHAFFPAKAASAAGEAMWLLVTAAIGVTGATVWLLDALLIGGRLGVRRMAPLVVAYLGGYLAVMAFVDHSYATVIYFYLPPLLLLTGLAAARALRERSRAWTLILVGLLLSFGAAALQLLGISLHPRYFNANALYHLVQGVGLAAIFFGFRRLLRRAPMLRAGPPERFLVP